MYSHFLLYIYILFFGGGGGGGGLDSIMNYNELSLKRNISIVVERHEWWVNNGRIILTVPYDTHQHQSKIQTQTTTVMYTPLIRCLPTISDTQLWSLDLCPVEISLIHLQNLSSVWTSRIPVSKLTNLRCITLTHCPQRVKYLSFDHCYTKEITYGWKVHFSNGATPSLAYKCHHGN